MSSILSRCEALIRLGETVGAPPTPGADGGRSDDFPAAEKQLSKKKNKKKNKLKKLSKLEKTKSEWPAALNITRVSKRLPLVDELVEHQCREIRLRLPGSDFSAARVARLVGLIKRLPAVERPPQYEAAVTTIVDAFESYRFWPTDDGKDFMIFWSENHMILYQSTQLLLEQWRGEGGLGGSGGGGGGAAAEEEEAGKGKASQCKSRVLFFLRQKKRFGFFEFNSHGYIMFTLSALLNLVDFSADSEVVALARSGVDQILGNVLAFALPSGAFFSVTGRGYLKHRKSGKGYDVNNVIYMLTGVGDRPRQVTSGGAFFATSTYARAVPAAVLAQWRAPNHTFCIGQSVDRMVKDLRDDPALSHVGEMVPFLWSMGAYFHPAVVRHTVDLLSYTARAKSKCMNLWRHDNFAAIRHLRFLPTAMLRYMSRQLYSMTAGSVLTGQVVTLHKSFSAGLVLASVRSCEGGCVGFQKVPWIASIGNEAVWTGCGTLTDLRNANELVSHASLPATAQWANVCVIAYQPASMLVKMKLGSAVFAHWPSHTIAALPNSETSVVIESSRRSGLGWALARVDDGYLALGCSCLRYDKEASSPLTAAAESCFWVCVVGTRQEFGCYDSFVALCKEVTGSFDEAGGAVVHAPAALFKGQVPPKTTAAGERIVECRFLAALPESDSTPAPFVEASDGGGGASDECRISDGTPYDDGRLGSVESEGGGSVSEDEDEDADASDSIHGEDEDADASDLHEKGLVNLVGSAAKF